ERRPVHSVDRRRLVSLVDDADRREHEAGAQGETIGEAVIQIGLLQGKLAPGLTTLELRVLDLQLGAERQPIVEGVRELQAEAAEAHPSRAAGGVAVRVVDPAAAAQGAARLGQERETRNPSEGR